jgi:hypothetical protein
VVFTLRTIEPAGRIATGAAAASTLVGIYARSGFVRAQLSISDTLKFPESSESMRRHPSVGNPAINGIPGNAEVFADLHYRRPALNRRAAIRAGSCGHNPIIVAESV